MTADLSLLIPRWREKGTFKAQTTQPVLDILQPILDISLGMKQIIRKKCPILCTDCKVSLR